MTAEGKKISTVTETKLRELGTYWSKHVLEGVYSWILVFCYILATVISGYPFVSGIAVTIEPRISRASTQCGINVDTHLIAIAYVCGVIDAIIYVFSPQWCCMLLRVIQGRPLLHRMTGRSVVIGGETLENLGGREDAGRGRGEWAGGKGEYARGRLEGTWKDTLGLQNSSLQVSSRDSLSLTYTNLLTSSHTLFSPSSNLRLADIPWVAQSVEAYLSKLFACSYRYNCEQ